MTWVSFRFAVCFARHLALAKANFDKDFEEPEINGEFFKYRKKNKGVKRRQWWAENRDRFQEGRASHSWGSGPRPPWHAPPRTPRPPPYPPPPPPPPPFEEPKDEEETPLIIVETPGP